MRSQSGLARLIAVLLIVGIVVILVVAYLVTAVVVSANEKRDADAVLDTTFSHQKQIDDSFNDPNLGKSFGSANFDAQKTKSDITAYLTKLTQGEAKIDSDQKALRAQDDRLKQQSLLTLPRKSELDHEKVRVEAALGALDDGKKGISIFRSQFTYFDALVDLLSEFDNLNGLLQKQDTAGALNLYPELDKRMQKATELSHGPNIPPQFVTLTASLKTLLDDIKGLLQAIQANDRASGQNFINKLDADGKAVQNFDENGFNDYENKLIKPLEDGYKAGLTKAQS